ncbi:hypothetical protein BDQ17DRAFT_1380792 [Cyathus striatus]|nr:hypothetical protein BDQ17DRAFT_1380792 [Cyathus striatus]
MRSESAMRGVAYRGKSATSTSPEVHEVRQRALRRGGNARISADTMTGAAKRGEGVTSVSREVHGGRGTSKRALCSGPRGHVDEEGRTRQRGGGSLSMRKGLRGRGGGRANEERGSREAELRQLSSYPFFPFNNSKCSCTSSGPSHCPRMNRQFSTSGGSS